MVRVSTGVPGLDAMLNGGLIKGRVYLLKGAAGTGKTILGMHFAMEGVKNGEDVLYITLGEPSKQLVENMRSIGFDFDDPHFRLVDATPINHVKSVVFTGSPGVEFGESMERLLSSIISEVEGKDYSRVVVDPITMMKLTVESELKYRKMLLPFLKAVYHKNTTVLLISEEEGTNVEEYMVSGVIELLRRDVNGASIRGVRVTKFRGSAVDENTRPLRITSRGMVVLSDRAFRA